MNVLMEAIVQLLGISCAALRLIMAEVNMMGVAITLAVELMAATGIHTTQMGRT